MKYFITSHYISQTIFSYPITLTPDDRKYVYSYTIKEIKLFTLNEALTFLKLYNNKNHILKIRPLEDKLQLEYRNTK